jgi:glucose-6-phosphate isomerase
MALAQVFNANGLGRRARAVVPYSQRLRLLPPFSSSWRWSPTARA